MAIDLELTWQYPLSEFRPKQTKAVCVNRVYPSLWASMALCTITSVIHVGLIATLRVSLITSFQPPLGQGLGMRRTVIKVLDYLNWE